MTTAWDAITAAIGLSLAGQKEQGRADMLACWNDTIDTDHAQRCVLAHYLADFEPELDDEVAWDERAVAELAFVTDGDLAPIGIPRARAMAPSLHLNLGDGYLRQRRVDEARG